MFDCLGGVFGYFSGLSAPSVWVFWRGLDVGVILLAGVGCPGRYFSSGGRRESAFWRGDRVADGAGRDGLQILCIAIEISVLFVVPK